MQHFPWIRVHVTVVQLLIETAYGQFYEDLETDGDPKGNYAVGTILETNHRDGDMALSHELDNLDCLLSHQVNMC